MQVLTPSGYKSAASLANGDEVCAFDLVTGAPIVNQVENIDFVDYAEWCRWWQVEESVPDFAWYRINGEHLLFGEQSIWRNGTNVCHAKHLVVGDVIHDDHDQDLLVASVETVTDNSLIWYRFDISNDHSYIIDGITVHNASRFWVGGTGTWDSSTTTPWSASTGGAGGQSVPGSADAVTLDGASGGGTVTLNFGGTITIQSITLGAFTGTFDNSVNNNNMTLSAATGFSGTGSGVRTYRLGTATYTLTATSGTPWAFTLTTNLTYTGNTGANITFTATTGFQSFAGGAVTHGNVTLPATTSGSRTITFSSSTTITSLTVTAPIFISILFNGTLTISNAFTLTGSASAQISINSTSAGSTANLAAAASSTMSWAALRDIICTGSPTATNSFNLGNNSGITINPPFFAPAPMVVARGTPY